MKNKSGITLVSLVITIIILLILSTVTITISVKQFDNMQLKAFYSKLEIAQQSVEKIAQTNESYIDENNNVIYLTDLGTVPTETHKSLITSLGYNSANFKFFTSNQLEKELDISGIDMDLLIDFNNRVIISPEGININGKVYYMLEDNKYTVKVNEDKNVGTVDFNYTVEKYGESSYKLKIEPINIGDIKEGIVKYRKNNTDDFWSVAENNEIITNKLITYDIIYIDANNNSKQKTIALSLDSDGNVISTEE